MEVFVLGEFGAFTLIYEENSIGGILNWDFFGFCSWVHVGVLRRGDQCVFRPVLGGTYLCVGFCVLGGVGKGLRRDLLCTFWGNLNWGAAWWCEWVDLFARVQRLGYLQIQRRGASYLQIQRLGELFADATVGNEMFTNMQ
jgi:hypothetical protein